MKKLLSFCLGIMMSAVASGQYAQNTTLLSESEPILLRSKGCRIYAGNEKLDQNEAAAYFSDIGGRDRSSDYLNSRKVYRAGVGLTVTGSVIAGAGFGFTAVGGLVAMIIMPFAAVGGDTAIPDELHVMPRIGAYTMLAGGAFLGAGIPLICVHKKRIKALVSEHNSAVNASEVEVSFGGTPSGIGLALRF